MTRRQQTMYSQTHLLLLYAKPREHTVVVSTCRNRVVQARPRNELYERLSGSALSGQTPQRAVWTRPTCLIVL
eukprot:659748-Pleurochrysis_carterae.AAC.2